MVSHLCSRCLSLVVLRHKWLTFWQELYSQHRLCMIMLSNLSMFFLADREIHFCKFFKFFVWALFEECSWGDQRPGGFIKFVSLCFICSLLPGVSKGQHHDSSSSHGRLWTQLWPLQKLSGHGFTAKSSTATHNISVSCLSWYITTVGLGLVA